MAVITAITALAMMLFTQCKWNKTPLQPVIQPADTATAAATVSPTTTQAPATATPTDTAQVIPTATGTFTQAWTATATNTATGQQPTITPTMTPTAKPTTGITIYGMSYHNSQWDPCSCTLFQYGDTFMLQPLGWIASTPMPQGVGQLGRFEFVNVPPGTYAVSGGMPVMTLTITVSTPGSYNIGSFCYKAYPCVTTTATAVMTATYTPTCTPTSTSTPTRTPTP